MRRALSSIGAVLVVVAAAACGDVYAEPDGENLPVPRVDGRAILPKDVLGQCPAQRPNENGPCSFAGSTCEYGPSPDMQCNKTYACTPDSFGQYWLERSTDRCTKSVCPTDPADIESLDGKPCSLADNANDAGPITDADEAICAMTNGICACTTGPDAQRGHERRWVCIRPNVGGCPTTRPRAGEGCAGNLWCDYGSCKWKRGLLMQCKENQWLTGGAPCN